MFKLKETLHGGNMPFTIGIQIKWQKEMMLRHGHESGVYWCYVHNKQQKGSHISLL
jgi:hypothetical protein